MKVKHLIEHLGRDIGRPELQTSDQQPSCTLSLEGGVQVVLEFVKDPNVLHIYTELGVIPAEPASRQRLYTLLMEGHLFGYATGGAYFGASEQLGKVVFFKNIPAQTLRYDAFRRELDAFVSALKLWRGHPALQGLKAVA
jgi:hypothetical protein